MKGEGAELSLKDASGSAWEGCWLKIFPEASEVRTAQRKWGIAVNTHKVCGCSLELWGWPICLENQSTSKISWGKRVELGIAGPLCLYRHIGSWGQLSRWAVSRTRIFETCSSPKSAGDGIPLYLLFTRYTVGNFYKRVFFQGDFTFENLHSVQSNVYIHQIFKVYILIFSTVIETSQLEMYQFILSFLLPYTEYLSCFHLLWKESTPERFVYLIYLFKVLVLDLDQSILTFAYRINVGSYLY